MFLNYSPLKLIIGYKRNKCDRKLVYNVQNMTNIIISDLHLEEGRPDIADLFLRFLQTETRHANALYILGDFFEVWIGDDDLTSFNLSIMNALRETRQRGLPIYIMHGNRDFLIGKKFIKMTGCQLLPDEYVTNLSGVPTLMMHGDTLCTDDIKYMKFRKKMRNWFVQKFILMKSLKSRRSIAKHYREVSKAHVSTVPDYIMDVNQNEVERVMLKHSVFQLIHGHTHRKAVHSFCLNDIPAARTVLGPWHEYGNALICRPDGIKEFIDIKY